MDTGDSSSSSAISKLLGASWNVLKVEDLAPQLYLYSELVKPMADGKPIKLAFAVLTKTKVPELTVHDVPLDPQQVERTQEDRRASLAGDPERALLSQSRRP